MILELRRLRAICFALPDVEEKLSHGAPAFFAKGRQFVHFWAGHHDEPRTVIWCAAPLGLQETLIAADPDRFFRPPYVGHRGWIGVSLENGPDWDEVAHVVAYAHRAVTEPRRAPAGRGSSAPRSPRR